MYPASDSGGRFYPVSGIVYHGVFRCAGYIDGTDRRPFFFWRTVSAAAPCFHGISDYRSVGAFFLRVSLFLRNDAGAYFLFFQKDCLREGTDSETVGPHPEISEVRNIGPDNGRSLGTGAAGGFFLESLGRVREIFPLSPLPYPPWDSGCCWQSLWVPCLWGAFSAGICVPWEHCWLWFPENGCTK